MEGNITGSGKIIKCMVKVNSLGLMVEDTKGNMKMIKNMGKGRLFGQMAESMREAGKMGNKMELVFILEVTVKDVKVNGKKEEEFIGIKIIQLRLHLNM